MVRSLRRGRKEARDTLLVTAPLVLAVVLCGAIAWLTLLSGSRAVAAGEAAPTTLENGTAPDRDPGP